MPTRKNTSEVKEAVRRTRVVIGDLDVALFKFLHEYRLLRRDHFSLLTGRHATRVHRRLHLLVQSHHLKTITRPQEKHIYALGQAAVPYLVREGIADASLLVKRSRVHELSPFFLEHEMMISDVHACLELAMRGTSLRFASWRQGRELHDHVPVDDHDGLTQLTLRPDAFFTLEDAMRPLGRNQLHFFVEADRSSEGHPKYRDKIRAYWHYLRQGLHEKKFGIPNFRMLTVAATDARATNLSDLAQSLLPERALKYFLFTSLKRFGLENPTPILEAVHLSPSRVGVA